jgi:hypothetical protein
MTTRILLGQLGSNGDCLYATTIARQIKHDFPGCHLTWAISSLCRRVILNNPDVDEVWELPVDHWGDMDRQWRAFEAEGWKRVANGDFDRAFMTQICPNYFHNYDGTIRPSQFRNYPRPITVPVETVIEVTLEERERVEEWVWTHNVDAYAKVVLFGAGTIARRRMNRRNPASGRPATGRRKAGPTAIRLYRGAGRP